MPGHAARADRGAPRRARRRGPRAASRTPPCSASRSPPTPWPRSTASRGGGRSSRGSRASSAASCCASSSTRARPSAASTPSSRRSSARSRTRRCALRDRRARHLAAARYFEGIGDDELAGALAAHYVAAYRGVQRRAARPRRCAARHGSRCGRPATRAEQLGAPDAGRDLPPPGARGRPWTPPTAPTCSSRRGNLATPREPADLAIELLRRPSACARRRTTPGAIALAIALHGRCPDRGASPRRGAAVLEAGVARFGDLGDDPRWVSAARERPAGCSAELRVRPRARGDGATRPRQRPNASGSPTSPRSVSPSWG